MISRAILRSRAGRLSRWLRRGLQTVSLSRRSSPAPQTRGAANGTHAGGKLGDISDLADPAFGAGFRGRYPEGTGDFVHGHRKLWELAWLAQRFDDMGLAGGEFLGLGVGHEPLIFHLTHLSRSVVATDLYSSGTAWQEARLAAETVYESSPFPYQRDRLTVRNMDMRRLEFAADSFDAVWSCSSVEHVQTLPQFVQIFREIHRVLRPGGVALVTTEFSLGDPYFLPGVLSLWKDSAIFGGRLRGLTPEGPVDLHYRGDVPGNRPIARRDARRLTVLADFEGGPSGICIHVGYTRSIPVALALRKTGPRFDWPEHLGAPGWYVPFAAGVELFADRAQAAPAADLFRRALAAADTPGARLHCYRALVEAHVHACQVKELHETLAECRQGFHDFPDDDDAFDLIGYVAGGQGFLPFARRCWERACASPSVLPGSRLRIRINQLEAELAAGGPTTEARHVNHLAESAWYEALDTLGGHDPMLRELGGRLLSIRERYQLGVLASPSATAGPAGEAVDHRESKECTP